MIPNLTTEQRRENLEKAKAARQRRAAILKGVADGSYSVPDVLNMAGTDDTVARMKVFTLIKAARATDSPARSRPCESCTFPNRAAFAVWELTSARRLSSCSGVRSEPKQDHAFWQSWRRCRAALYEERKPCRFVLAGCQ